MTKGVKGVGEKKVKFASEFACPHCGFLVSVETGKIIKKQGIKPEYEEYMDIKKSEQTKLESETEDQPK